MRVAVLVHRFPELSETFIVNEITGLIDAGFEVDIFASGSGRTSTLQADIRRYQLLRNTHYWTFPRSYLLRAIRAVGRSGRDGWCRPALPLGLLYPTVRLLRRRRYGIVHCQFGTLAGTACALYDIGAVRGKLVVSYRGSDLAKTTARFSHDILRKAHLFLPVCERFKEELIRRGCDPRKVCVHHSGVKLPLFTHTERRRIGDEPIRLLSVGRLVEKKGMAYAIRAIALVKAWGRHVVYTVAGDGPLRTDLDRLTEELGLRAEVRLIGPRSHEEVLGLLRDAHLFLAPCVTASNGDQEGIPNVLKEAMATGLPVISTRHSGIPELVEDAVSGILVPEGDSTALAHAIVSLIDHPERWAAMGRAGRQRVEAEFNSNRLNDELVERYKHLIRDDGRATSMP